MIKELERITNNSLDKVIKLNGELIYDVDYTNYKNKTFPFNGLIDINKSNVIIDGSNSTIQFNIKNLDSNDCALFYIHAEAENVEFRNLNIKVRIDNDSHANAYFMFIYNTARNFKLFNSNIEISSERQMNLVGIYNNGNLFTHMETRADNMLIDNNIINLYCLPDELKIACFLYGIYNNLANSITVTNNHIYTTTLGNGDAQRAIGVYTNGRYGRYIGNNIKANGSHPAGLELEQASAYGFINEGLFTIINANNIVAQWAGIAIGIENKGEEALITSNKVLSTHNIFGRCIRNYEGRILIDSNMLVSTSKNARMVEHNASNAIISNNFMEILLPTLECITGCGIYSDAPGIGCNTFVGNIMFNMKTCGLFVKPDSAIIANNQLASSDYATLEVLSYNQEIKDLLDESRIKTIIRE